MDAIPVRSPLAGHVMEFTKVIGQVVKAEEPLVTIHDLASPMIQGYVSERDLRQVRIGQPARVRLVSDPETVLAGKVVRSGRIFDADQSLSLWVQLDHYPAEPLRHHQLARLSLVAEQRSPVVAVPVPAIVAEGRGVFVFVLQENGIFERRKVVIGRRDDRYGEVIAGLKEGERIAVRGTAGLQTAHASVR
jgi:RND family efflux transporter MFP subunit